MNILSQFFSSKTVVPSRSEPVRVPGEKQKKSFVIAKLLREMPWLWAIKNNYHWSDEEFIRVTQDLGDLRTVLSQLSHETRFHVWAIVTCQYDHGFGMRACSLSRREGDTWAEAVMCQMESLESLHYLVLVDPLWGENHPTRRITVFRHPTKEPLNQLIEESNQLHGSKATWRIASEDY